MIQQTGRSSTPKISVSVVVPVWNERTGVSAMLRSAASAPLPIDELVFVDAGSTDGTQELVKAHRGRLPVSLLEQREPGFARAVLEGLEAARGEVLVTMDGDGAHRLADVAQLIAQVEREHDLVVATRYGRDGRGMPGRRWADRLASRAAALAFRHRYRIALTDPLHGFRARTRRFFRTAAPLLSTVSGNVWMGIESLLAERWGLSYTEVPVRYGARIAGEEHKRLIPQGLRLARYLLTPPKRSA
jgi:glycosyltransferase involved in cell wall biosynthesis